METHTTNRSPNLSPAVGDSLIDASSEHARRGRPHRRRGRGALASRPPGRFSSDGGAEAATVIRGRRHRRAVDTAGEATGWPTAIAGLLRGLSSP